MALKVKHGTCRITSTGMLAVEDFDFDVYAVILTATETADENFHAGAASSFGAYTYNPYLNQRRQFAVGWSMADAAATTATRSGSGNLSSGIYIMNTSGTSILRAAVDPSPVNVGLAPITSLNLDVTVYSSAVGFVVNYMAIGGDGFQAHIGSLTLGTTNGSSQDVNHGLANCSGIIFATAQETSTNYTSSAHARPSFGMLASNGRQHSAALYSRSAAADSSEFQIVKHDSAIAGLNNSSSEAFACSVPSFSYTDNDPNSNSFRFVTDKASGTAHRVWWLAFEGCDIATLMDISGGGDVESFTSGYQDYPNNSGELMITPSAVLALSLNNEYGANTPDVSLAKRSDNNRFSLGMSDGRTASSIWHGSEDNQATTNVSSRALGETTKNVLAQYNSYADAEIARAALGRFDTNGYTLHHSEVEPTNLLLNGSFEVDISGVTDSAAATSTRVSTWADSGLYSLRNNYSGVPADLFHYFDESGDGTVTPGETYYVNAKINATTMTSTGTKIGIAWYTAAGASISISYSSTTTATGIYDLLHNAVAPLTADHAKVYIHTASATNIDYMVDHIQLCATSEFGFSSENYWGFLSFVIGEKSRATLTPTTYDPAGVEWRFRLADSATFEDILELTEARQRQLQLFLNKPGSLSFELPLESAQALKVKSVTTCVKAYRDGELVWSGPVWTIQDSAPTNKTTVNCVGWLELLNHKVTDTEINIADIDASGLAYFLWYYSLPQVVDYRVTARYSGWSASGTSATETISPLNFEAGSGWSGLSVDITPYSAAIASGTIDIDNSYLESSETDFSYYDKYRLILEAYSTYELNNLNVNFDINDGSGLYFDTGSYTSFYSTDDEFPGNVSSVPVNKWFRYYECNFDLPGSLSVAAARAHIRATWSGAVDGVELKFRFKIEVIERGDDPFIQGFTTEPESTQLRTRIYPKFSNVGQEISALSEIEAGFDYQIDPEDRGINIYRRIGEERDILFAYNYGPDNIKSISTTTDPARMTNRFIATGQTVYETADDTDSQEDYGLFVELGSAPSTNESLILAAYANAEVALRSQPIVTYDLVPMSTTDYTPAPFVDYSLGDVISFSASKGRINIFNKKIRIFGMAISIDDNGVESVTSLKTVAN